MHCTAYNGSFAAWRKRKAGIKDEEAEAAVTPAEVESDQAVPTSLKALLASVADPDAQDPLRAFGRVEDPLRALRTPAIKAYRAAGGDDKQLDKNQALPEGFHVLQVCELPPSNAP